ncbi:MAG: SurA N-terminal domain-containing protein [Nitrospirae bacterium]|nr:SurA N-terminal domain-containing protein [Nitrospirota bacterium]
MIKFMHKHAKFFYIFFFLIIISFIFFYIGPVDNRNAIPLIEVADKKIYADEYWKSYENAKNYYQTLYKGKLDSETEKKLNLKQIVLNSMVENELLLTLAGKLNITISDDEVADAIAMDQAFIRDGSFNKEVYLRVLQLNRMTPTYYETKKRQELIIARTRKFIELAAVAYNVLPPDIPEKMKENKKLMDAIMKSANMESKSKLVSSYVEGLKRIIPVKIRSDIITQS